MQSRVYNKSKIQEISLYMCVSNRNIFIFKVYRCECKEFHYTQNCFLFTNNHTGINFVHFFSRMLQFTLSSMSSSSLKEYALYGHYLVFLVSLEQMVNPSLKNITRDLIYVVKTRELVGRALTYCKGGRGGGAVYCGRLGVRIPASDRPKS